MRRLLFVVLIAASFAMMEALPGATRIVEPATSPYHVALDASHAPVPFTVAAGGFAPGSNVFAEQCDGRAPTAEHYNVTVDCDIGSAPPPAIADAQGVARWDATNPNRRILFFAGASPQGLFNCVGGPVSDPHNNLPTYKTCQIRVSSNNTQITPDQVYLTMTFDSVSVGRSSSSKAGLILGIVAVDIGIVALLVALGRRSSARERSS